VRAARVVRHGRPTEAIEIQDIAVPEPDADGVRVRVAAAPLNWGDIARCRGGVASVMTQPPFTLGMDVCGVVDAVGDGAEQWLGRRVVAVCNQSIGGIAEAALAPKVSVFDAPEELDDVEAAAFTLPFHTMYLALHKRARLQAGETLLVLPGASALGTAAIQLGVAAGAEVVAIAGGREKGLVCEGLGAKLAIDSTSEDTFDRVMDHTGGRGADVVCDMVGGDQTETIWTCIAHDGRYVPVGFNDDPQSGLTGKPLRRVSMGNFSVVGVMMAYGSTPIEFRRFGVNMFPPETGPAVHAALRALVRGGAIRPTIGRRIGMGGVATALEDHEQRRTTGRTVVDLSLP
jgi:NADPH2:quinone reductase